MEKQNRSAILIAIMLVLAAAISRVLLYPHNFSPVIGMAVFSGAVINDRRLSFLLPLLSMFLADVMFEVFHIAPGFWGWGQLVGYGILALITIFAFSLRKITVVNVIVYSLASSVIFFLLSNLSFFLIDNPIYHTYPSTVNGFFQCYIQALPFFRTNVIADLVYSGVLFGGYYVLTNFVVPRTEIVRN